VTTSCCEIRSQLRSGAGTERRRSAGSRGRGRPGETGCRIDRKRSIQGTAYHYSSLVYDPVHVGRGLALGIIFRGSTCIPSLMRGFTKVVESPTAPKSYLGAGAMRCADKDGGIEAIGDRIIELPQDKARARARNPRTGLSLTSRLAASQRAKPWPQQARAARPSPCAICHDPGLKGLGDAAP
jgi:hypothetical protein